jgi:hypothetical protein
VFYCGVWDDEGLAEAHDELDGEEYGGVASYFGDDGAGA